MAEEAQEAVTEEAPDYLAMSDEEFENLPLTDDEPVTEVIAENEDTQEEAPVEEPESLSETVDDSEETEPEAGLDIDAKSSEVEELSDETEQSKEADSQVDYKREYEKLLAPFPANHGTMQVSSVEEAIKLMQMGANYAKKMRTIKPNMRFIQTLQDNDLLDENKLNFLIALHKKDPAAIRSLVGAEGVESLGYGEEVPEYVPPAYTVGAEDIEVRQALEDIKDSPAFNRTVDVISNKLDNSSQRLLSQKPALISTINGHIQLGVYDQIMGIVEQRRLLGEFEGVPDLEAYRIVGDYIDSQGGFNQLKQQLGQTAPAPSPIGDSNTGAPFQQQQSNSPAAMRQQASPQDIADRKRAASPTRGVGRTAPKPDVNYLQMSDEEFERKFPNLG